MTGRKPLGIDKAILFTTKSFIKALKPTLTNTKQFGMSLLLNFKQFAVYPQYNLNSIM